MALVIRLLSLMSYIMRYLVLKTPKRAKTLMCYIESEDGQTFLLLALSAFPICGTV